MARASSISALPCPGCGSALDPGCIACKPCYFAKVPAVLRNEYAAEAAYCKKIGHAHTQRLLQLQASIKRIFAHAPAHQLFTTDHEAA